MSHDMRKLIVTTFISLDGVVQGPGGEEEDREGGFERGGWTGQFWNDEPWRYKAEELARTGALLLGRKTYDIFAASWPTLSNADVAALMKDGGGDAESLDRVAADDDAFADRMNSMPKYVASTTLTKLDWNNSTLLTGDIARAVADLKSQAGKDIVVHGSGGLAQTLMQHNLIDEYRLMIFPIVVGGGKRLFRDGGPPATLKLTDTKTFSTGVAVQTYAPADAD